MWKTLKIHAKLILKQSVDNTQLLGVNFLFDLDKFWQFFNAEMKKSYSTVAYNAWFKNTKPISFNKKTKEMIIAVESPVAKGYWEKNTRLLN